ncbi:hypothetical protein N8896_01020 [Candidatus Pelagibacter ubique]|nr:hypothetical protein [Candidatus Pelagibacter ubique]
MKKLKVGFLINNFDVDFYTLDLIKHVKKSDLYFDPVIIHGYKKNKLFFEKLKWIKGFGLLKGIDRIIIILTLRLIKFIEIFNVKKKFPNYIKRYNLKNQINFRELKVDGVWSKSKLYLEFGKKELEIISKEDFDCIIRCGSGILRGQILDLPKFGILSFHHGDNRVNRGGPSGFWEVMKNEPSSGFIIQKLTNQLDAGDILLRGNIMTANFFTLNHAQLLEKSHFFLKKILDDIAFTGRMEIEKKTVLYSKNILKINRPIILIRYLFKILFPIIFKNISKYFISKSIVWSVAYKKKARNQNFFDSTDNYKKINNPKNRFFADPFVFKFKERNIIFVEDYSFKKGKGNISAIELNEDENKFLGSVLEEDFHLSFPYVFQNDDDIYMIPETSQINEIRLYKCTQFPKIWKLEKILMKNISAADTMLIKKDLNWFMLTNICSSSIGDHQSELHIFYNDNFISTDWKPLKQGNPVIFDSNKARNGGIFYLNNKIYRVNQIHGKAHYGRSFGINELITINKNTYIEKRIKNIEPNFIKKIVGTHHFNANLNYSVIDYAQKIYSIK